MLDPQLHSVAVNAIDTEFHRRKVIAANAVGAVIQDFAKRGLLNSTVAQAQVCKVIAEEFVVRANLAWQVFAQLLRNSPAIADMTLGTVLRNEIASLLENSCDDPPEV